MIGSALKFSQQRTSKLPPMISAIHRKKMIAPVVLLIALVGMTLSFVGETSSHGLAELSESILLDHSDHSHSHDDFDKNAGNHPHHDAGNHSHETEGQQKLRLIGNYSISLRQLIPYAGDSPRSFRYRLDRPPKASLIV